MVNVGPNGVGELVEVGRICVPGEAILIVTDDGVVALGSGLQPCARSPQATHNTIIATCCGVLRKVAVGGQPVQYYVATNATPKYVPRKGDPVIGTIVKTTSQSYIVNIGAALPASLDVLAFDGATKSNRPRLRQGDVIYAHVVRSDADIETEISCCAVGANSAKDWTTGEGTFGPVAKGALVQVPLADVIKCFRGENDALSQIGDRINFEACIGLNGFIWVASLSKDSSIAMTQTIAISECLRELMSSSAPKQIIDNFFPYV